MNLKDIFLKFGKKVSEYSTVLASGAAALSIALALVITSHTDFLSQNLVHNLLSIIHQDSNASLAAAYPALSPNYYVTGQCNGAYPLSSPASVMIGGADIIAYNGGRTVSPSPNYSYQRYNSVYTAGTTTIFSGDQARVEWSCNTGFYHMYNTITYNVFRSNTCDWSGPYADPGSPTGVTITGPNGYNYSTTTLTGSVIVSPPGGPGAQPTYQVSCQQSFASVLPMPVVATITDATISFTANPSTVSSGATSTLTWATQNLVGSSCKVNTATGGVLGTQGLGSDTSGNANNWTTNAIVPTDQLIDSPTNNFTNLSQNNYYSPTYGKGTVTNGGLATGISSGYAAVADWQLNSGKWYWEYTIGGVSSAYPIVGIFKDPTSGFSARAFGGHGNDGGVGYASNGTLYINQNVVPTVASFTNGDVIAVAYDADTGKVYFSKNGVWQNSGNPVAGTGYIGVVQNGWPNIASYYGKSIVNFGQGGVATTTYDSASGGMFKYTPPSGYKAISTNNLPAVAVAQPLNYFNAVAYAGNGSTQSLDAGFIPDLVWIKNRTAAYFNTITDSLRGANNDLFSNSTSAATASDPNGWIQSFSGTTFTVGGACSAAPPQTNLSGNSYAAWAWKKSPASGTDIVTYQGTGLPTLQVGHALGTAPDFMIVKRSDGVGDWYVWNSSMGGSNFLKLNTTDAASTASSPFPSVPTASNFSVAADPTNNLNASGAQYVAYLFSNRAGFQQSGVYVANNSADGAVVYTGFKPKYVMIKDISRGNSYTNWVTYDSTRDTSITANPLYHILFPNLTVAENNDGYCTTNCNIDFLASGFKIRGTSNYYPTSYSTDSYVYIAFADIPFKSAYTANGYTIPNSLRFDASNSTYMALTPSNTASSNQVYTASFWMKRGSISGTRQWIYSDTGNVEAFGPSDTTSVEHFHVRVANVDSDWGPALRDSTGWTHVVISVDTTQPTASNRVRVFFNGVQQTLFAGTYPAQNATVSLNQSGVVQNLGRDIGNASYYFDGNLADFYMIDGQALDPTSFGAKDSTGVWKPKTYTGGYGNNGFKLNFSDSLNVGVDSSGRGNNFSPVNASSNDVVPDTPTNNFADLNANNYYTPTYGKGTIQAGGQAANGGYGAVADWQLNSGKWYWEYTVGGQNSGWPILGIFKDPSSGNTYRAYPGHNNENGYSYQTDGTTLTNTVQQPTLNSAFVNGDVVGVAYDADSGNMFVSKNGVWQNGNSLIPVMTGQTTAGVTMTASRIYSGGYEAWRAGDRGNNDWYTYSHVPTPADPDWLRTDFGSGNGKTVASYSIKNISSLGYDPINFTFEGSNDASTCTSAGTSWTVLDTETNVAWVTTNQSQNFVVPSGNRANYQCYRIKVTGAGTITAPTYYLRIQEIGLYANAVLSPTDGSVQPIGTVTNGWPGLSSYYGKTYVNFGQGGAQSTTFTDASTYTRIFTSVTTSGLPTATSTVYKFGSASAYFNGSTVMITPSTPELNQTGDFTIDFWAYSKGTTGVLLAKGNNYNSYEIYDTGTSYVLYASSNGSAWNIASNSTICPTVARNTWNHVAVVHTGGAYQLYCNGNLTTTITTALTPWINPYAVSVGANTQGTANYFNGMIDEVRISNTARWTSAFTPQSSAYASDANTLLLMHMENDRSSFYNSAAGGYYAYTPPTGYKALSTANLGTQAVSQPNKYFDAKAYSGTGGGSVSFDAINKGSNLTLSNGNFDVISNTNATWANGEAYSTYTFSSGKYYAEFKVANTYGIGIGIADASKRQNLAQMLGYLPEEYTYDPGNGRIDNNNVITTGYPVMTAGDTIMVAVDMDAGKIWFGKNGTWFNSGNPSTGTGPQYSGISGTKAFGVSTLASDGLVQANFGQSGRAGSTLYTQGYFMYQPPTGFSALPTGSNQDVPLNFQPDLVWVKNRLSTDWNVLVDSSRGANVNLFTNASNAQTTNDINGSITAFNTKSFTAGGTCSTGSGNVNAANNNYVAWIWNKSPIAGIDIVSYAGDGTALKTIPHSLGTKPDLILTKRVDQPSDWFSWNSTLGGGNFAKLNTTDAATINDSPYSNDLIPTMTAATTNGVTITASSQYSTGYLPWYIGDKIPGNYWASATGLPQWIQVDFGAGNAKTVGAYTITPIPNSIIYEPTQFTLQGSNNGTTFTTLDTENVNWTLNQSQTFQIPTANQGSYRYYRLNSTGTGASTYIEITELNLWDTNSVPTANTFSVSNTNGGSGLNSTTLGPNAIPTMTGPTTNGVTMSASTEYSASYLVWKAGDKSNSTIWNSANTAQSIPSVGAPQWLQTDFGAGNSQTIGAYSITKYATAASTYDPSSFTLRGSNDPTFATYTVLDTQANISWNYSNETKTFYVPTANQGSYRYYRLNITANNGNNQQTLIAELSLQPVVGGTSQYVSYLFSNREGFSKAGTYIANSSADGPVVYTGFKPKYVMIKDLTTNNASTNWVTFDSARDSDNPNNLALFPSLGVAENGDTNCVATCNIDFLANGFKIRNGGTWTNNYNNDTYQYIAFADVPFKSAYTANGYTIPNSLRFSSPNSTNLSRTFITPTDQTKGTVSLWVKRGSLGSWQWLFGVDGTYGGIAFDTTDHIRLYESASVDIFTNQTFKDTTAWIHLVVSYDTTAAAGQKIKAWANDVPLTFQSYAEPASNANLNTFGPTAHNIGRYQSGSYYFDGAMADFYIIDGQALDPTSFGAFDSSGYWKPIAYAGTYGANGAYLPFNATTFANYSNANGTADVGPLRQNSTYVLSCLDPGGTFFYATTTVTVGNSSPFSLTACNAQGVLCSSASGLPGVIISGQPASLTWSAPAADANSCNVTDSFSNAIGSPNTNSATAVATPAVTANTDYTLQCTINGVATSTKASVVLSTACTTGVGTAPNSCSSQCSIYTSTAAPTDTGATISWCCPSGPAVGANFSTGGALTGSKIVTPQSATSYTLTCPVGQGTVSVVPQIATALSSMTLTSTRVRSGNASTLSWTLANMNAAVSCSMSPALPGGFPAWDNVSDPWSDSAQTTAITAATRYTLSCGNGVSTTSVSTVVPLVPVFKEI